MVQPIKPSEVTCKQQESLPDHVIETWNRMIVEAWNGSSATIMQNKAVKQLGGAGKDCAWLNIEDIFRKAGWKVEYDKPGYNETYEASFKFSKKGGEVMTDEEFAKVKHQAATLQRQIAVEEQRRTNERYRQNIANLGITLDKAELSSGDDKPWFRMLSPFLAWCEKNSKKMFVEWNTLIYLRAHVDMNNPLCTVDMLEAK